MEQEHAKDANEISDDQAWQKQCCDFIERDWSSIAPGELAVCCDYTFDTTVSVREGIIIPKWTKVRPTITALIDARSRQIIAHSVGTAWTDWENFDILLTHWHDFFHKFPRFLYDATTDSLPQTKCRRRMFQSYGIQVIGTGVYGATETALDFRVMMKKFSEKAYDLFETDLFFDMRPDDFPSLMTFYAAFAMWTDQ